MERVLKGFADYLRQRLLLPEYGVAPYVRWVRYFLDFARPIKDLGFEPCVERFLAELNRTPSRPSWHAGQAKDALRVYYYQYRRGGAESPPDGSSQAPDIPDLLSQLSAAIRRKRHALNTEKKYVKEVGKFLQYRVKVGLGKRPICPEDVRNYISRDFLRHPVLLPECPEPGPRGHG